jgi:hypothetical protein
MLENYEVAVMSKYKFTQKQKEILAYYKSEYDKAVAAGKKVVIAICDEQFRGIPNEAICEAAGIDPSKMIGLDLTTGAAFPPPTASQETVQEFTDETISGEIFEFDGRIAVSIPPSGQPNSTRFDLYDTHPESPGSPAWRDGILAGKRVRIAPDICQPPYTRLADCLHLANQQWETIPHNQAVATSLPPLPHPNSEEFVFMRVEIAGEDCCLIDKRKRFEQFSKPSTLGTTKKSPGHSDRFDKCQKRQRRR